MCSDSQFSSGIQTGKRKREKPQRNQSSSNLIDNLFLITSIGTVPSKRVYVRNTFVCNLIIPILSYVI